MRLLLFGAVLALALHAVVGGLLSALVALAWRGFGGRLAASSSHSLLALRLLPAAGAGLAVFGMFLPAFLVHEPAQAEEQAGALLLGAAGTGLLLVGTGALRGIRALLAAYALGRRWRATGRPADLGAGLPSYRIEDPFPVACVIGLRRHRLYVANSLVAALDREELRAALAHERRHAERRDNLKALLMRSAPDALGRFPAGLSIERAWSRACEREVDLESAGGSRERAHALASALVKVARAAPEARPGLLAAGLLDEAPVAERVRHLLAPSPRPQGGGLLALLLAACAAAALIATVMGLTALDRLHRAVEVAVSLMG